MIKSTINAENAHLLTDMVEWVQDIGATCVHFQPLERHTPETYRELWVDDQRCAELEKVTSRLVEMKRQGAPILNSERMIRQIVPYFREQKSPPRHSRVGTRLFVIGVDGVVQTSGHPIGNIKDQSAREIWLGPKAADLRRRRVETTKLDLNAASIDHSIADRVRMGLMLLRD